jgi:hypothetical protein
MGMGMGMKTCLFRDSCSEGQYGELDFVRRRLGMGVGIWVVWDWLV